MSKPAQRKSSLPPTYRRDVVDKILGRLSEGEPLRKICRDHGMPAEATFRSWVVDDVDGLAARYARARALGIDCIAESLPELADEAKGQDNAGVSAVKLKIDTQRWLLSKMAPGKYGEKLDLNVGGELSLRQRSDEEINQRLAQLMAAAGIAAGAKGEDPDGEGEE